MIAARSRPQASNFNITPYRYQLASPVQTTPEAPQTKYRSPKPLNRHSLNKSCSTCDCMTAFNVVGDTQASFQASRRSIQEPTQSCTLRAQRKTRKDHELTRATDRASVLKLVRRLVAGHRSFSFPSRQSVSGPKLGRGALLGATHPNPTSQQLDPGHQPSRTFPLLLQCLSEESITVEMPVSS